MPTIPARSFAAQRLQVGQSLKVTNTSGGQVIDTWAFSIPDTPAPSFPRYMSMIHTRSSSTRQQLVPDIGEPFLDNKRDPILTRTQDTSPGAHDTLFAACSPERYIQLGESGDHDNCARNLLEAVKTRPEACFFETVKTFLEGGWMPDPLNLFMNVAVGEGRVRTVDPVTKAGDFVVLRAERECVVFMSACPMDIATCNGGEPTSAEFEVL